MSDDEPAESEEDGITLDIEGAGSADQAQTETVDPDWGSSRRDRDSVDRGESTETTSSEQTVSQESGAESTDHQSSRDDEAELLINQLGKADSNLPSYLESAVTPGLYDDLPYVFQRTGREKVKWDRPSPMRFDVFEEVSEQLNDAHEHFSEEVYPDASVMKADVQMAAMIAGYANPDDMKAILDAWGYSDI